jgi:transposase
MTQPTEKPKERDEPTIWEVDDALWELIAPLLVILKTRKKPGRPRREDRPIFNALIWLARTGAQWDQLPERFPPKSTVHDRFQEWIQHGCILRVWAALLQKYDHDFGLDWMWQAADGCLVKAPLGKKGLPAKPKDSVATPPTGESSARSDTCTPVEKASRSPSS